MTVKELIARSKAAQEQFQFATQEQADAAARAICKVVYDNAEMLGPMAAEESRMGNEPDKIAKCRNKSALIWESLKGKKSCDIINRIEERRMLEVAKPVGVVASIIPSTNPVVTPMSNGAFALKCRCSVIFAPHPRAVKCTELLVKMFREELAKLGLPEDLVQGLGTEVSNEMTNELMASADMIVATGGMGMVKAAYSSGKPAIGVGQGNVQCIIDEDADMADAVGKVIIGRAFDNGLICLGEQTVFVPEAKEAEFLAEMKKQGGCLIEGEENVNALREGLFPEGGAFSRVVVGMYADQVAKELGLDAPEGTRVLIAKAKATGAGDVLCREKLCPVMAYMTYQKFEEGVQMMLENLDHEGKGHSVCIHSNTPEHVEYLAIKAPVSRCIVNQPSGTTGGGSPTNGFTATTTLGCGTWGNNSFAGNLNYEQFLNITRVGYPYDESYLPDVALAWE